MIRLVDVERFYQAGPTRTYVLRRINLDTGRENVVVIVERWESLSHLEAHLVAPHMMEYRPKVREFISRVGLQILEPVVE